MESVPVWNLGNASDKLKESTDNVSMRLPILWSDRCHIATEDCWELVISWSVLMVLIPLGWVAYNVCTNHAVVFAAII